MKIEIPTITKIRAWCPDDGSRKIYLAGGKYITVAQRWQRFFKGVADLCDSGVTVSVDRQENQITLRDGNFKATIEHTEYPPFVTQYLLEVAHRYEDLT